MESWRTRITRKNQTSIPRHIRRRLGIRAGDDVEWKVSSSRVVVEPVKKIKNIVKQLVSKTRLNYDAVKLVREVRDEF
jgi:AbrB family looped-hinge helix DNA binding protein